MKRLQLTTIVLASLLAGGKDVEAQVFRSGTSTVFVNVSVTRGNVPVAGLSAQDFTVRDNGVTQRIDAIQMQAIPIDVTVLIDTSGSTAGALDNMQVALGHMLKALSAGDQLRLLTIGLSVQEPLRWTTVGDAIHLPKLAPVSGISLVYDGLMAAAIHKPAIGRAHVVIALTDGQDGCSVVTAGAIDKLAGSTSAVFHWVPVRGAVLQSRGLAICRDPPIEDRSKSLQALVTGTGGTTHERVLSGFFGTGAAEAFQRVIDDYRHSYMLHYTPEGVAEIGWHRLEVVVPSGRYNVRTRPGYYGANATTGPKTVDR